MAGEWTTLAFDQAVVVNPTVPLNRGAVYPFVDMQSVDPALRSVESAEQRSFTGGGSRFRHGDTLLARITPCLENGKIARYVSTDDSLFAHGSTEFIVIRGRDSVTDNDYAYYLTKWDGVRGYCVAQMTGSSGRQRVPTSALSHLEVSIPPLDEQQAIACILGTLDEKIELNRQRNRTLEAMARAIFQSWFVDFDPVRVKAEGHMPAKLSKELAAMFPKELVESDFGDIPKGWQVRPLPEVCDVNPIRSLSKGTLAPYLDMANMPTQGPSPEAWVIREMGSGMKFVNGDTLVARITPCLENGKTAFVDFLNDYQVGWGSTEYIVLRPKGLIPPVFAYLLARTEDFRSFAIQQMTGSSGRQRVPADSLTKYRLVSPNLDSELFERFGKLVTPLFQSITANMRQTRILTALRDTLLPKLISGELRVPDAERIVGRAT
jgi:type I restriction enzyme S subunit